ncbi:MAG: D-alanyl-D-alanine carboxypeptidase [Acidobacteriota bacterium]
MKRKILLFALATILLPVQTSEVSGGASARETASSEPTRIETEALATALSKLQGRRYSPETQGILVESLDGSRILAEWNAEVPFNPASVMKLATSFASLYRFGPDYRFRTSVYGDVPLDSAKRSLRGNVYLVSDGNPTFGLKDARNLARALARRGLRRVEGGLVVAGPFSLDNRYTRQRSADQLRRIFLQQGIQVKEKARLADAESVQASAKVEFLTHQSSSLLEILWLQNAHSVNEIADRLGDALGGPEAVEQFLVEMVGIDPVEIHVDRPSGLEYNRMSVRAAVKMLRGLHFWLEAQGMTLRDIMPVAGVDEGTLWGRFRNPDYQGAVLGKTGTNPSKDGGVSALAGLVYTRDQGPLLYAIFNTHGWVPAYRRWQDNFLKDLIAECGGVSEYFEPHGSSGDYSMSHWVPSEYWASLAEAPLPSRKTTSASRSRTRSLKSSSRTRR